MEIPREFWRERFLDTKEEIFELLTCQSYEEGLTNMRIMDIPETLSPQEFSGIGSSQDQAYQWMNLSEDPVH